MPKQYCPQCGDDNYDGKHCQVCYFPDCYLEAEDQEMIDLWEIEANAIVNSNEYEDSKNDN
jgi:hypothetical protein